MTTVCLVTYRRPHQVAQVLRALFSQRPPVRVAVWNNGLPIDPDLVNGLSWYLESSRNVLCPPRWWLAAQAETRTVLILDDDLLPATATAVASLVQHCRLGRCVGPIGALIDGRYRDHVPVRTPPADTPVDVVKGRCLAVLTDTLRDALPWSGVLTARAGASKYDDLCVAEDIAVCAAVAEGAYGRHLVPGGLAGDWQDLAEGPESLSRRADHMERRDRVAARWFR